MTRGRANEGRLGDVDVHRLGGRVVVRSVVRSELNSQFLSGTSVKYRTEIRSVAECSRHIRGGVQFDRAKRGSVDDVRGIVPSDHRITRLNGGLEDFTDRSGVESTARIVRVGRHEVLVSRGRRGDVARELILVGVTGRDQGGVGRAADRSIGDADLPLQIRTRAEIRDDGHRSTHRVGNTHFGTRRHVSDHSFGAQVRMESEIPCLRRFLDERRDVRLRSYLSDLGSDELSRNRTGIGGAPVVPRGVDRVGEVPSESAEDIVQLDEWSAGRGVRRRAGREVDADTGRRIVTGRTDSVLGDQEVREVDRGRARARSLDADREADDIVLDDFDLLARNRCQSIELQSHEIDR